MSEYHIARSGKSMGFAVKCPAQISCTIMPSDEHMTLEEAKTFNYNKNQKDMKKNSELFGNSTSLSKNDFSKKINLFENTHEDSRIASKQKSAARRINMSDRLIKIEEDKIIWKNDETETDISQYDDSLQNITLDRFNKGISSESEITSSLMESIKGTKGVKLDGLKYRLKSPASLARKIDKQSKARLLGITDPETIKQTRKAVADNLQDVVRYTFVVENHDAIGSIVELNAKKMLEQGYIVRRAEHSYVPGNSYMDAKMAWEHPETGEVFEVQYHSNTSINAKQQSHEVYEKLRITEDTELKKQLAEESSSIWSNMKIPSSLEGLSERTGIVFKEAIRK